MNPSPHIIISRTDGIGDVLLTLPMAAVIKQTLPKARISFLVRSYTQDIVACCPDVDHILNIDLWPDDAQLVKELAAQKADAIILALPEKRITLASRKAGIKRRIATGRRWHTLINCNRKVWFSRRKSNLHEAQLNLKLLAGLGLETNFALSEISKTLNFRSIFSLREEIASQLQEDKIGLVIHPTSAKSAHDWPLSSYVSLIDNLPPDFQVILTGTEEEKRQIADQLNYKNPRVLNLMGQLSIKELIQLISLSDGLLAVSTGPLHLAAVLGKKALGLYPEIRPMHPGRWKPLGMHAEVVSTSTISPEGFLEIPEQEVRDRLLGLMDCTPR